jgi:hypothetical protein
VIAKIAEGADMEFVLAGFRQDSNIRRYNFEAVGGDRTRRTITVGADLNLIRKYKIPLQDLPLLCRRLLEGRVEVATLMLTELMFTEKDMLQCADDRAAAVFAAAQKRRAHHPPASSRVGQAWRSR